MITCAQVTETSVNVTTISPSQHCTHPDDHIPTYDMSPGLKPLTAFTGREGPRKYMAVKTR